MTHDIFTENEGDEDGVCVMICLQITDDQPSQFYIGKFIVVLEMRFWIH